MDKKFSLVKLQRDTKIAQVISLVLYQKQDDGRAHTITSACKEVGVDRTTWHNWMKDGHMQEPLREVSSQMSQIVYTEILPNYQQIMKNMVSLALGKAPENSDINSVSASDMTAAFREIQKIIPIEPLDQQNGRSAGDHLDKYQPKQVFVQNNLHFVYQGEGGASSIDGSFLKEENDPDDNDDIIEVEMPD